MNTFSLEGAIVARAHSNLRTRIAEAMAPMRVLLASINQPTVAQEWRITFDKFENTLFEQMRGVAEQEAMRTFIATYEEVAAIVNAAKAKERVVLKDKPQVQTQ